MDNGIPVFVGAADLLGCCNGSGDNIFPRLAVGGITYGIVHRCYLHIRFGRQCLIGVVSLLVLHLVGRFFLTIVITLAYTVYRRLSISQFTSSGLGIVGM